MPSTAAGEWGLIGIVMYRGKNPPFICGSANCKNIQSVFHHSPETIGKHESGNEGARGLSYGFTTLKKKEINR